MKKKYYATIQTVTLNEITIVIKAETKKEANEILKKQYKYKKVVSLKATPPIMDIKISKGEKLHMNGNAGIYVNKVNRTRLFG